jgi:hypothetical protein
MVRLIKATVLRSQAVFLGANLIFRLSETSFSITEKTVGKSLAPFMYGETRLRCAECESRF